MDTPKHKDVHTHSHTVSALIQLTFGSKGSAAHVLFTIVQSVKAILYTPNWFFILFLCVTPYSRTHLSVVFLFKGQFSGIFAKMSHRDECHEYYL